MENNKILCCVRAPAGTASGYGSHSRDIINSLIKLYPDWDIRILNTRWGGTPQDALNIENPKHKTIIDRLWFEKIERQPDIWIQISIPSEFKKIGAVNIGITAGIETTVISHGWVEGCNRMDHIIVPSKHSKEIFQRSVYDKKDKASNTLIEQLKIKPEIDILFEGVDNEIYKKTDELHKNVIDKLSDVEESWAFLFCGHYLQGDLGHDRKDVGMLVKTFLDTFKNKSNKPALILKTSGATFSYVDLDELSKKIYAIRASIDSQNLPNIYILHGALTDEEMNSLYNHPKVKCFITFTHGEGWGRPMAEFAMSGKPILASNWSGHIDFLSENYTTLLPGQIEQIHPSATWKDILISQSGWFRVNYSFAKFIMNDIFKDYKKYQDKARGQIHHMKTNFSMEKMEEKLKELIDIYIKDIPRKVELKLPNFDAIELPELKHI